MLFTDQNLQEGPANAKNPSPSAYLSSPTKSSSTPAYGDIPASAGYNTRFTPISNTSVNNRPMQSHTALPFPSRRSSPATMNLLQATSIPMNVSSTPNAAHMSSFKQSPLSMGSALNANSNYVSIASTVATATQSNAHSSNYLPNQNVPATPYTPLSKHWLWNSSLFYQQSRSLHDGFLPYPSQLGQFFGNKLRDSALHMAASNSVNDTGHSKNADISASSYCSDLNSDSDSLDVSDHEKVSPALLAMASQKQRPTNVNTASAGTMPLSSAPAKKRNPYSIEELLKKPEKKLRLVEPISFQPSIIIHNDESSKASSPSNAGTISDTNDSFIHSDIDDNKNLNNNNNNHITIEVCD